MEELDWPAQSPDLNPIKNLSDELEFRLRAWPGHPTSVPDLTNALVAEWKQVPAAMFQHLVESLPRRVEAVTAATGDQLHINAHDSGMRCSTSIGVSIYFWSCSVYIYLSNCLSLYVSARSIGVLTYVMLTGTSPFLGEDKQETFLNISQINVSYQEDELEHLDQAAIAFIKLLLVKESQ